MLEIVGDRGGWEVRHAGDVRHVAPRSLVAELRILYGGADGVELNLRLKDIRPRRLLRLDELLGDLNALHRQAFQFFCRLDGLLRARALRNIGSRHR